MPPFHLPPCILHHALLPLPCSTLPTRPQLLGRACTVQSGVATLVQVGHRHAHLNAHIVNVVGFIKDHNALLFQLPGNHVGHLYSRCQHEHCQRLCTAQTILTVSTFPLRTPPFSTSNPVHRPDDGIHQNVMLASCHVARSAHCSRLTITGLQLHVQPAVGAASTDLN